MTNEPSPRPWRVMRFSEEDEPDRIVDANGDEVAIELLEADAVLIVDAVNERAKLKAAHMKFPDLRPVIIAAGQRDAAIAERDRLRDIVRRLADSLQGIMDAAEGKGEGVLDESLLREARAAIEEEKE